MHKWWARLIADLSDRHGNLTDVFGMVDVVPLQIWTVGFGQVGAQM
jgi:hypothetical protein